MRLAWSGVANSTRRAPPTDSDRTPPDRIGNRSRGLFARPGRYVRLALVLFLGLGLTVTPGWAEASKRKAKQAFILGQKAFKRAEFAKALGHYKKAFTELPLPGFLFNIGQCLRNMGDKAKAVAVFKLYLAKAPQAKNRKAVEALIAELEQGDAPKAAPAAPPADNPEPESTSATDAETPEAEEPSGVDPHGDDDTELSLDPPLDGDSGDDATASGAADNDGAAVAAVAGAAAATQASVPAGPTKPWYKQMHKKWWFWAAVATAVGAGVAGTYVIINGTSVPDTRFPMFDVSR